MHFYINSKSQIII